MGWCAQHLGIESILVKYFDDIVLPTSHLSSHIMEAILKIEETNPESEALLQIYPVFL